MTDPTPLDARFIVDPDISPRSLAPEQRRAKRSSYYAEQGFGAFPDDIAEEGGPDKSVYLMGARWEGVSHMASQEDDMRDGYFISARKTGPWRWILWRCSWDDNESAWWWTSAGATSWTTKDPAGAGREMIRRLWASWGSQGAPEEIDECGLMHRHDIESLVGEVFTGLPASAMESLDANGPADAPEGVLDAAPNVPPPATSTSDASNVDLPNGEMLASTSDAELARILGIRYRNMKP